MCSTRQTLETPAGLVKLCGLARLPECASPGTVVPCQRREAPTKPLRYIRATLGFSRNHPVLPARNTPDRQPPARVELLWPKTRPRFIVVVELIDTGQEFQCVGFSCYSRHESASVNSATLRSLPVGKLVTVAVQKLLRNTLDSIEAERKEPSLSVGDFTVDGQPGSSEEFADFLRNRDDALHDRQQRLKKLLGARRAQATGDATRPAPLSWLRTS